MVLREFTFIFHDDFVTLHFLVLWSSINGLHHFFYKAITPRSIFANVNINPIPLPWKQKRKEKVYTDFLKNICIQLLSVFNHKLNRRGYSTAQIYCSGLFFFLIARFYFTLQIVFQQLFLTLWCYSKPEMACRGRHQWKSQLQLPLNSGGV